MSLREGKAKSDHNPGLRAATNRGCGAGSVLVWPADRLRREERTMLEAIVKETEMTSETKRDRGQIRVDGAECKGCGLCIEACPPKLIAMSDAPEDAPENAPGIDPRLLEILVCPVTRGPLTYDRERQELVSASAKLAYPIREGVPIMLPEEARTLD